MNYLFSHLGSVPKHLLDSIQSVLNADESSSIILCSDEKININNVTCISINEILSEQTIKIMDSSYFRHHSNPLWKTSLYRIFLIRDLAKKFNLNEYVHFDSDVILYYPFSFVRDTFAGFDGLHITPCNKNELVFGYSFFNNFEKHNIICDLVFKIATEPGLSNKLCQTMANEMEILGAIKNNTEGLIKQLKTIPDDICEYVFDPSSYGQYFGGTHNNEPPGWAGDHHWIGEKINKNELTPIMVDNKPFVVCGNKTYPIINLHIHSKQTEKFLI